MDRVFLSEMETEMEKSRPGFKAGQIYRYGSVISFCKHDRSFFCSLLSIRCVIVPGFGKGQLPKAHSRFYTFQVIQLAEAAAP
jgi:hypothetical protein